MLAGVKNIADVVDDADAVEGPEKFPQTNASTHLQSATWHPAQQSRCASLPKHTEVSDDRQVTDSHSDGARHASSVCDASNNNSSSAVNTRQIPTLKCDTDLRRLNSPHKDELCSASQTGRRSSDIRVSGVLKNIADEVQLRSENTVAARRRGRPKLSDFGSMSSACTQSAGVVLEHPRRTSAGVKRKLSTSKYVPKIC